MSIILFVNIFIDISSDPWTSIATFIVFIVLAFYLIKIILRESKQRELLSDLTTNLSLKVAEQTTEIRHSYDLEKKARRELEKLNETKDQFIMITQHNLRTPVTGLRYQLESILSNDNGQLEPGLRKAVVRASEATDRLNKIVDDFLAITAIKAGGNILTISQANLLPLIKEIIKELKMDIDNLKLTMKYPGEDEAWPSLPIDTSKVREALL
ncbi:MAG: histidine kinase dimerization/phospho-acceptor domain-containing protein, partial [Candidatus Paceibacterota bacterium]